MNCHLNSTILYLTLIDFALHLPQSNLLPVLILHFSLLALGLYRSMHSVAKVLDVGDHQAVCLRRNEMKWLTRWFNRFYLTPFGSIFTPLVRILPNLNLKSEMRVVMVLVGTLPTNLKVFLNLN